MRKSLPLNSYTLFVQLGLSTLFGLTMSFTHANTNNTTAFSDADFAAHAVKAPPVVHDDDDGYNRYDYRRRYAEISEKEQQIQKAAEEQQAYDAQISSIPRSNESEADYQARMEKERNPVWMKRQAQAKLQAQILDQQEEKRKKQSVSAVSNNLAPLSGNNLPTKSLDTIGTDNNVPTAEALSASSDIPTNQPTNLSVSSYDSIPRTMSMGKGSSNSLFFGLGIIGILIVFVRLISRSKE